MNSLRLFGVSRSATLSLKSNCIRVSQRSCHAEKNSYLASIRGSKEVPGMLRRTSDTFQKDVIPSWEGFMPPRKLGLPRPSTPQETFLSILPIREEYQPLTDFTYPLRPFHVPRKSGAQRAFEEQAIPDPRMFRVVRNTDHPLSDLPPLTSDSDPIHPGLPVKKSETFDPHRHFMEEDTWGGPELVRGQTPFKTGSITHASRLSFSPAIEKIVPSDETRGTGADFGSILSSIAMNADKNQVTLNDSLNPAASSFRTMFQPINETSDGDSLPGLAKSVRKLISSGKSGSSSNEDKEKTPNENNEEEEGGSGGGKKEKFEGEGKQGIAVWRKKIQSIGSYLEILEMGTHSKLTRGGRVRSLSFLILVGNEQGTAALGYGKAETPVQALEKAQLDATHRPLHIRRQDGVSIASQIQGRYLSSRVHLWPNIRHGGNRVGPEMAMIIGAFGLSDICGRALVRRGPKNVVQAVFDALRKSQTVEQMARSRGKQYVNHNTIHRLRKMTHTWGPSLSPDLIRPRYL